MLTISFLVTIWSGIIYVDMNGGGS